MSWIYEPWPWYIAGPVIALIMVLLLLMEKNFGMSSNLRTMCAACGAGKKVAFFNFDWKAQRWNLLVVAGSIIGGFIASNYMTDNLVGTMNPETIEDLRILGFEGVENQYLPAELFALDVFSNPKGLFLLAVGGLLVGFGARYAGGCTSGHAISGLSELQLPSLIAVIGFFVGGLIMIYFLFPLIF